MAVLRIGYLAVDIVLAVILVAAGGREHASAGSQGIGSCAGIVVVAAFGLGDLGLVVTIFVAGEPLIRDLAVAGDSYGGDLAAVSAVALSLTSGLADSACFTSAEMSNSA